ncbi:MAG: dihydrodipicolinate synthase family protein [Rhodospirillales bacterium]|jgi:4-hydroxy-tetrahydrodipicolinate synthase|nr:dihydrodipicolinate synthase family protein [Rhodospirillales bacterium]
MANKRFSGVLVPALTPFKADLSPDRERFVANCKWLLDQGADGLAAFGTTSEANSMSIDERMELLEALVEAGIPASKLMPGTGACSITDSIKLTKQAVELGCGGVLMLPPFYYKGVSDEGLFANFSEVIQRVGSSSLQVYLYHIPPQAVTPISLPLIEMLVKAYPDTVVGLKDSSGDWSNTEAVIKNFPGFTVFPGSETFLLQGLRAGGAGCITATGNVNPAGIRKVYENWQTDEADALQARITEVRMAIQAYPLIPALKRMVAHFQNDPSWEQTRPPLGVLNAEKSASLLADLKKIGFELAA